MYIALLFGADFLEYYGKIYMHNQPFLNESRGVSYIHPAQSRRYLRKKKRIYNYFSIISNTSYILYMSVPPLRKGQEER